MTHPQISKRNARMPITAPIAFTIESYHSIVRSLPECSSKAVGTCKCIVTFLSNSFGKQKRTGRFAKFWREQTSLLWHLHHGDTLTFVLGPLLLTTLIRPNLPQPLKRAIMGGRFSGLIVFYYTCLRLCYEHKRFSLRSCGSLR